VADPQAAPTLGQHTDEVLRQVLGLGDEAIQALIDQGVLGTQRERP
jgi:crotonobetainyl-CoA:carnitine CoA-transferase CaiB-like acyl-CoA transferase